ncbi:ECF transporter S component [candidate division LCP-89 bacterium B3_LCP]|uniref:ECF transporter S component n=1 Tax=candidate division LCP-89 bacterium B3_LCP TaxID=2012998 RepID=A0A532V539_UNCL8|nr:MAG: ECF transporter S component [candidate division LCP-89 bacterium B3_LCP]
MIPIRSITISAFLIAAGIASSFLAHITGIGGRIFLPLHYPALLAGLLFGWRMGITVGLLTPLMSAILTGMPPLIPSAILMVPELVVYGLCSGLLRKYTGLYPALLISQIMGRLAWGAAVLLLTPLIGLQIPVVPALITGLVMGLPGIIGQIILIPLLVVRLERSGLVIKPVRD